MGSGGRRGVDEGGHCWTDCDALQFRCPDHPDTSLAPLRRPCPKPPLLLWVHAVDGLPLPPHPSPSHTPQPQPRPPLWPQRQRSGATPCTESYNLQWPTASRLPKCRTLTPRRATIFLEAKSWLCAELTHKGVNQRLKYATQVQQRPESPTAAYGNSHLVYM